METNRQACIELRGALRSVLTAVALCCAVVEAAGIQAVSSTGQVSL